MNDPSHPFDHERLDVYHLSVEVNHWFAHTRFPAGRAHLHDQGLRAADSVVLNIGEGAPNGFAKQGKRHFKIALGSAAEAATILDLLPGLEGAAETQQKLRRIGAILRVLSR